MFASCIVHVPPHLEIPRELERRVPRILGNKNSEAAEG